MGYDVADGHDAEVRAGSDLKEKPSTPSSTDRQCDRQGRGEKGTMDTLGSDCPLVDRHA